MQNASNEYFKMAFTDELTGIYNRRFLNRFIKDVEDGTSATPFSLLMMDVDFFKKVNDNFGHAEGDKLLKAIADSIKGSIGPTDIAIRYAGDEFVVILMQTDSDKAAETAEFIRDAVYEMKYVPEGLEQEIGVSVSIGVASFPDDSKEPADVLKKADSALYNAKYSGKNKTMVWNQIKDSGEDSEKIILARFPSNRLFERDEHVAAVAARLNAAVSGKCQLVLVKGDPGTGKTRFISELIKANRPAGYTCLIERCTEESKSLPYTVFSTLFNNFLSQNPDFVAEIESKAPANILREMAEFLSVFASHKNDAAPKPASELDKRKLIFKGFLGIVKLVTARRPMIVLLDDAENADTGTLELVSALVKHEQTRTLICATLPDLPPFKLPEHLKSLIATAGSNANATTVRLTNLPPAAARELVESILPGIQTDNAFHKTMFEASGGNPLFIEKSLQNLITTGKIKKTKVAWFVKPILRTDLPKSLDELLSINVNALDPETQKLISQAAIIGPNFSFDFVKQVSGLNDGEAMDMVDKALDRKVIEADHSSGTTGFNFPSSAAQKATYDHADDALKKQVHLKIGNILEAKKDSPEFLHLMPKVAFHYRKGGDDTKADIYDKQVEEKSHSVFSMDEVQDYFHSDRKTARIQPAETPLPDDAAVHAGSMIKNLCSIAKNMRMYPKGSALIISAVASLDESAKKLFAAADTFTISLEKEKMAVNTVPVDDKAFGGGAGDMRKIFSEHHIQSLTFVKEVTPDELSAFAEALSQVAPKGFYPVDQWTKFMDASQIKGLDVVQQAYVSQDGSMITRVIRKDIASLTDDTISKLMVEVLRNFSGTIENMKMYPPGSQLIVNSVDLLNQNLGKLFERIQGFSLALVEGNLLINGTLASQRAFGSAIKTTVDIMTDCKISSLSFLKGVTRDQIDRLLTAVSLAMANGVGEDENYWVVVTQNEHLEQISIDQSDFSRVGTSTDGMGLDEFAEKPDEKQQAKPTEEQRPSGQARPSGQGPSGTRQSSPPPKAAPREADETEATVTMKLLALPPEGLLDPQLATRVPSLIQSLLMATETELALRLFNHFMANMQNPSKDIRLNTAQVFEDMQSSDMPSLVLFVNDNGMESLISALKTENEFDVFSKYCAIARSIVEHLIIKQDLSGAKRMLWSLLKQREADKSFKERLLPKAQEFVSHIATSQSVDPLFETLKSRDLEKFTSAIEIFYMIGPASAQRVYDALLVTQEAGSRKTLAGILKKLDSKLHENIGKEISPYARPEKMIAVLKVLDLLIPDPDPLVLINAMNHQNPDVKVETVAMLRRLKRDPIMKALNTAMQLKDENAEVTFVSVLGDIKSEEYLPLITNLMESTSSETIQKECIMSFGKIASVTSIPKLKGIVEKSGGFLGMGSASDNIRAAAVWALGNIKSKESEDILSRVANDKSPSVRSAAKLGIANLAKLSGH